MVVLGLVLLLVAAVAAVVLIFENTGDVTIHAFGGEWNAPAYWLAVLGAIVLVVAVVGIVLIRSGSRRGMRRRREIKELERRNAALSDAVAQTDHTGRPSAGVTAERHYDVGGEVGPTYPSGSAPRNLPPTAGT